MRKTSWYEWMTKEKMEHPQVDRRMRKKGRRHSEKVTEERGNEGERRKEKVSKVIHLLCGNILYMQ